MGPIETIFVDSKKVSCDGVKILSGHPKVYLDMGNKDYVVCPYCSKYFTIKKSVHIVAGVNTVAIDKKQIKKS